MHMAVFPINLELDPLIDQKIQNSNQLNKFKNRSQRSDSDEIEGQKIFLN